MRHLSPLLVASYLALVACGDSDTPLACESGHACAAQCVTPLDCGPSQECNGGLCANPLPTLTAYSACAIDPDCPAGDHCELGACSHQCVADRDCSESTICDARGRCVPPEEVGQLAAPEPPVEGSAVLSVEQRALRFLDINSPQAVRVENTGVQALSFRLQADQDWLDAQPATGVVAGGGSLELSVRIRPGGTGETEASLSVISSGGTTTLPVSIPSQVGGVYRGEVLITGPSRLGARSLGLFLRQEASGALTGVVDDASSPVFPFKAALEPESLSADGTVDFTFIIPAPGRSRMNPLLDQDVRRTIRIVAQVLPGGTLSGDYTETVEGLLSEPILLSGKVVLEREGSAALPQAQQLAVELETPAGLPDLPCATCPSGAPCPGSDLDAGLLFLDAAFPFYESYRSDGYVAVARCLDGTETCLDASALQCAQVRFHRAYQADPEASCTPTTGRAAGILVPQCAVRGLLDSLKGLQAWQLLAGNELLVRAHDMRGATSLTQKQDRLFGASVLFQKATGGESSTSIPVRGILDPFWARFLDSLPETYHSAARPVLVPERLGATPTVQEAYTSSGHTDVLRIADSLERRFQAAREDVQVRQRLGHSDTATLAQAELVSIDGHLRLAMFAALAARTGLGGNFDEAAAAFSALAERARQLRAGLNPVGLRDSSIAYTYNPAEGPLSNNFKSQLADFRGIWLARAAATDEAARAASRDFELSQHHLSTELASQSQQASLRLALLCGGSAESPEVESCGSSGGEVFEARQELLAAAARAEQAAGGIERAYAEIEIEQNRAAQAAGLHTAHAQLILENGDQMEVLSQRADDIRLVNAMVGAVSNAAASVNPLNPLAALSSISTLVGGAAAAASGSMLGLIDRERESIALRERAQVELNIAQGISIDSAARIKTLLLEIPSLKINVYVAHVDATRALARLKSTQQSAIDAQVFLARAEELQLRDPRQEPAFRLHRNGAVIDAEAAFHQALKSLFLLTRSLEYELNYTYAPRDGLFALTTPQELDTFAAGLSGAYNDYIALVGQAQARQTVLSLRDDVFQLKNEVVDGTTSNLYSPQELFRRFLANPRHKDGQGNAKLSFTLSLAPETTLFNEAYCNDRLTGVRASLVGAELGVTAPEISLEERGTAYLRSCTEQLAGRPVVNAYGLESTLGRRRAIVQAGVNLSGPTDPNAPPVNTELFGRPLSGSYELIIDRNAPANRGLDLSKVDDIILFIGHETRTVR